MGHGWIISLKHLRAWAPACPLTPGDPGKLQHQVADCNMMIRTHVMQDVTEGSYVKYRDAAHCSLITEERPSRAELLKQG